MIATDYMISYKKIAKKTASGSEAPVFLMPVTNCSLYLFRKVNPPCRDGYTRTPRLSEPPLGTGTCDTPKISEPPPWTGTGDRGH